jgi:hypothetical protein
MMPDCVVPTVKRSDGSVMVWRCFSGYGTGDLVKINGIMKKEQYKPILQENAVPSGLNLIGHGFMFQQRLTTPKSELKSTNIDGNLSH